MNQFRLEAFKEEFPFLESIIEAGRGKEKFLASIKVKRLDESVLNKVPHTYSWTGSLVGIEEWVNIDFILEDGTIIHDAVKPSGTSGSNYAYQETVSWEGESILEAIARQGVEETLRYVVETAGGYNIVNHYSEPDWVVFIYKLPRRTSLGEKIEAAKAKEKAEVAAECNF